MKSFFFLIYIVFFGGIFISCKDTLNNSNSIEEPKNYTAHNFGNASFTFPNLSNNAKEQMIKWVGFEDFEMQIKSINGSTIEDLKNKSKILVNYSDSLTNKMPDTLKTQIIMSRVIVAQTMSNLLHQEIQKSRIDSLNLQKNIHQINIALKNLLLQIDEKFQKDNIDLTRKDNEKKELEKQKRFLDSVYQSELNDQKK